MEKRILLGLHNEDSLYSSKGLAKAMGYSVDTASNLKEMLNEIETKEYEVYLMDTNLNFPGSPNITSAIKVYELLKPRIDAGLAKFLTISGTSEAVKAAEEQGIPSKDLFDFRLMDFLK